MQEQAYRANDKEEAIPNVATISHYCNKCGKEESYSENDINDLIKKARWHKLDLGRMGYGSSMDGSDIEFEICDSCLKAFIMSFENPDSVTCSGSNCYSEES